MIKCLMPKCTIDIIFKFSVSSTLSKNSQILKMNGWYNVQCEFTLKDKIVGLKEVKMLHSLSLAKKKSMLKGVSVDKYLAYIHRVFHIIYPKFICFLFHNFTNKNITGWGKAGPSYG